MTNPSKQEPGAAAGSARAVAPRERLRIIPLGGLGEAGMNCMAIECGDDAVLVDYGLTFPDMDAPGVEKVIPDDAWIYANQGKIRALLVTHGHEDHIGAMPFLLRWLSVPVYGPPMALGMLAHKLREHDILGQCDLRPIPCDQRLDLGMMSAEFIHMNHSIPDARAVVLRTPYGTVVHSGDWRVDHNPMVERSLDISALARLGDEGVRCLLADSTNVEQEGVPISETEAVRGIGRVLREAKRRVLVTMFSSNVHRLQGVLNEAHAQGRRVLLWGRSLHTVMGIARELGELKLPSDDIFLDSPEEAAALAPHRLLIVATGSQGEPQAALARIIRGDVRSISLDEGDCVVFSARVVPGNERVVSDLINELHRRGVDVVTARDAPIHTTGHAHREDMRWLLRLLRPKVFVPIHGTPRMLTKHAKLAKDLSIPQVEVLYNGDVLELDDAEAWRGDPVHAGKILIDASAGCPVAEERLRQRRNLAFGGVVLATMAVDPNACDICSGPSFKLNGVVFHGDTEEVLEEARQYVLEQFESVPDAQLKDLAAVDDFLRQAVRRYFRRAFQIKPVVMTLVLPVVR